MNKTIRLSLFLCCFFLFFANIIAAVPPIINLQLHVASSNGKPITGNIALTVRLFDGEYSNNVLYTNDISDRYVIATEGYVNYNINNVYGIDFSKEIWAEISIDGTTMPERIKFSTVPYAFFAARAQTADQVDTANIALSVLTNSINSGHIVNSTLTNADIAPNTILPSNINTSSNFDWTGQHNFKSNNSELILNNANYALQITKGVAKLLKLEGDSIVAKYILADTFSAKLLKANAVQTDTLSIANYVFSKNANSLILQDAQATGNGIMLDGQTLSYILPPTFATDAKNAIINKEYVDSTNIAILENINQMAGTLNDSLKPLISKIDSVKVDLITLTSDLQANRLSKWDGSKFINSNIIEQGNLSEYSDATVAFSSEDSLALINKRYVDNAIDNAIKHVANGIYASLSDSTVPIWNTAKNIFENSRINESGDTIRIGGTRFIIEDLPLTTSIENINHLTSNSLWTSNIWAKGIATNIAEYTLIDPISKLPENANQNTLAPVAYITKVADSLVKRIETDSINGARLNNATVTDAKIVDLNGNKIHSHSITGGYNGQIAFGTIIDENIREGSIRDTHIVSGAVFSRHILNGSIQTEDLADSSVTASKLASETIDSSHIKDAGISTKDLADLAITNEKLANGTITNEKLANNTITGSKLAHATITGDKIQTSAIANYHISDSAVANTNLNVSDIQYNSNNLESNNYMPENASERTLTTKKYVDSWVSTLQTDTIDGSRIKQGSIGSIQIGNGAVQPINLAAGAVTNDKLDVSNIEYQRNADSNNYMPEDASERTLTTKSYVEKRIDSVQTAEIDGGRIAEGSITTREIKDGTVASEDIAINTINHQNIASGAIMDRHLSVQDIKYLGNSGLNDYMPGDANNATLTTVAFVLNSIADSRDIAVNNADTSALTVSNSATNGTALQINHGNVVLSVIDYEDPWDDPNLPTGYVVYNLFGALGADDGDFIVHLPTPVKPGQLLYISNNTFAVCSPIYLGGVVSATTIAVDSIATFIAITNFKDPDKRLTWRRVK